MAIDSHTAGLHVASSYTEEDVYQITKAVNSKLLLLLIISNHFNLGLIISVKVHSSFFFLRFLSAPDAGYLIMLTVAVINNSAVVTEKYALRLICSSYPLPFSCKYFEVYYVYLYLST